MFILKRKREKLLILEKLWINRVIELELVDNDSIHAKKKLNQKNWIGFWDIELYILFFILPFLLIFALYKLNAYQNLYEMNKLNDYSNLI